MIGRNEVTIANEDTPEDVIREFCQVAHRRNILFLSNQIENLVYTYIKTFMLTTKAERPIRIIVSNDLYQTVRSLWRPVILRQIEMFDPVVRATIGKGQHNFAESHRLYPLTDEVLSKIPEREACIIFSNPQDIATIKLLNARAKNSDIILSGTMAIREEIPSSVLSAKPRSVVRIASPDWSFHSAERDLAKLVQALIHNGTKILLFHNYRKRIDKFIKTYQLNNKFVFALGDDRIDLRIA